MKIFDPKLTGSIEIQNTITGNVTIAGGLTVEGSLGGGITGSATASYVEYSNIANKPTLLSGSSQIASDISGSFTSLSSSLATRVASQEAFSSSLDATFATDAQVATAVSSLNAATSSYLLNTTDTLTGNLTVTGIVKADSSSTGDYVRLYGSSGTGQWDIYGNGENLRFSENSGGGGSVVIDNKIGIGVSPSTIWSTSYNAFQIGAGGSLYAHSSAGNALKIGSNIVYEGTAPNYYDKYLNNSTATKYEQDAGTHSWHVASSGTTGNAVSWTEAMRIINNGNVGIGTNGPRQKLNVNGHIETMATYGLKASYNNTDAYHGSLSWATLQLGNNGDNRIIGGRTAAGGNLKFYVNNTNDATQYSTTPDGTLAMTIASNGNVGINMTGPETYLGVNSGGSNGFSSGTLPPGITIYGASTNGYGSMLSFKPAVGDQGVAGIGSFRVNNYETDLRFYTNNTSSQNAFAERMRIKSDGNVGIGAPSPSYKLSVNGNIVALDANASDPAYTYFGLFTENGSLPGYPNNSFPTLKTDDTDMYFSAEGEYCAFLGWDSSDGHGYFGLKGPGTNTTIRGGNGYSEFTGEVRRIGIGAGGAYYIGLSGNLSGYTANAFNAIKTNQSDMHFDVGGVYTGYISANGGFTDVSDASLKTNVETITGALSIVQNLTGRRYNWIDENRGTEKQVGFIAQEVEEFLPEVVTSGAAGTKGVSYGKITALLVEAIKELKTENDSLKARIEALEG